MKGRKPIPTRLRIISGNRGHRPLNLNEPQAEGELKTAPKWMTAEQKKIWRYAIRHAPAELLRLIDQSALVTWVVACDQHRQAALRLSETGMLIKTPNGMPMPSPYLHILNRQAQIMLRAAEQLGFSPASRTRIQLPPQLPKATGSKWEAVEKSAG